MSQFIHASKTGYIVASVVLLIVSKALPIVPACCQQPQDEEFDDVRIYGGLTLGNAPDESGKIIGGDTWNYWKLYQDGNDNLHIESSGDILFHPSASGNMGLGLPAGANLSSYHYNWFGIDLGGNSSMLVHRSNGSFHMSNNAYFDGSWKYKKNGAASNYYQNSGGHYWRIADTGLSDGTIDWDNYDPLEEKKRNPPYPEMAFYLPETKQAVSGESVRNATFELWNINFKPKRVYVEGRKAPDYIFDDDHQLMPLVDLRDFLKEHRHLPSMPKGREIEERGFEVGEFQMKLLEEIEKLTLYTIQQQELIDELKSELESMKQKE